MRPTFEIADGAWEVTSAGALRCRARVLAVGVMAYSDAELGSLADGSGSGGMLVTLDSLAEPRSLRSLEGVPVVIDQHTWLDNADAQGTVTVGYVAGAPVVEPPYLLADLVITERSAIDRIKARQIAEVSTGYEADSVPEQGDYDGQAYVGRQTQIRYNHIALLPAGGGRGGHDVRILNSNPPPPKQQEAVMADPIRVRLRNGKTIHVMNEDDAKAVEAVDHQAETATADASKLEGLIAELETLKKTKGELDANYTRVTGELQSIKEQLEAALSPEAVETAAQAIVNQREEAAQVMNCQSLPEDMKTLIGDALRTEVVTRLRAQNGLPTIPADKLADANFVAGLYEGLRHTPEHKRVVNGSGMVQNGAISPSAMNTADNRARFDKLYGAKK